MNNFVICARLLRKKEQLQNHCIKTLDKIGVFKYFAYYRNAHQNDTSND
jgi:hypothetical protein